MESFKNKRFIITGGEGFLGKYVVTELIEKGISKKNIFVPSHRDYDLIKEKDVKKMFSDFESDVLIHLAAKVGGIGYNKANPGTLFYDNIIMSVQIMEQARLNNLEKFVAVGTICAYPKFTQVPFKEENLWEGYPEETNAPYGLAKKMLLVQSQAYRQQYGFNSIFLLPVNLYGPGDNFNPESSHVIPALIKKCCDAIDEKKDEITVWGSGKASREFLYVKDAAEGIVLAAENYDRGEPVNLGAGFEITIKDLVEKVVRYTGFKGKVNWDKTKPDGQPRRGLGVSRAEKEFGFRAKTYFDEGLKDSINWYQEYKNIKR